jgi:hypothetical protein
VERLLSAVAEMWRRNFQWMGSDEMGEDRNGQDGTGLDWIGFFQNSNTQGQAMQTLTVRLTGTSPTIIHSGQMANPMNKFAKALKVITGKRKKADEDFEAMAKIEFMGSLYLCADGSPGWPGENLEAMLGEAARKSKEGKIAKMAIFVDGVCPLIYSGPKTADGLWEKEEHRIVAAVKVGMARVMRTRPIFRQWELIVPIQFDEKLIDRANVLGWCNVAGSQIGLSDWRPRYGRFSVSEET